MTAPDNMVWFKTEPDTVKNMTFSRLWQPKKKKFCGPTNPDFFPAYKWNHSYYFVLPIW
jgi:hypothetical protein